MSKAKVKSAPVKANREKEMYTLEERIRAGFAAEELEMAFEWAKHPWGEDFWVEVHGELVRIKKSEDEQ